MGPNICRVVQAQTEPTHERVVPPTPVQFYQLASAEAAEGCRAIPLDSLLIIHSTEIEIAAGLGSSGEATKAGG